jgi:hypothetical protein
MLKVFRPADQPASGLANWSQKARHWMAFKAGQPDQVKELSVQLQTGTVEERMDAARKLGEMKAQEAREVLVTALNDPDDSVRGWAAGALGKLGDESAIRPLIDAMEVWEHRLPYDDCGLETRCLTGFCLALRALTGCTYGLDSSQWEEWWCARSFIGADARKP